MSWKKSIAIIHDLGYYLTNLICIFSKKLKQYNKIDLNFVAFDNGGNNNGNGKSKKVLILCSAGTIAKGLYHHKLQHMLGKI